MAMIIRITEEIIITVVHTTEIITDAIRTQTKDTETPTDTITTIVRINHKGV